MDYSKAHSKGLVNNYIEEIEIQKKSMAKNFEQMDFQNAVEKDRCGEIVDDMINNCSILINKLKGYSFS
ncbi:MULTISPECIES: hypothetical protein [Clostridium]|uniref:Spo0E like sporulation regulatory protein n=1 Tax=Clostridium frigoriphilum TaxID=443253 RepID=A0ABU7UW18_9CLOT|nr:hypothetical protein [Clostridium sp. DSM 17811]MBU3102414.1 hypothetical protein [Clostridium sp. DSM 17811]